MKVVRNVNQTIAVAKRQVARPSAKAPRRWKGLCLAFVRTCWGFPPTGIFNANEAWRRTKRKRIRGTPPPGAPIFWAVGRHGHIALSAGNGRCYSNDIRRSGRIDLVPISEITRKWGARYRGWGEDYVGTTLPITRSTGSAGGSGGGSGGRTVDLSKLIAAAQRDPKRPQGGTTKGSVGFVRIVENALQAEGLLSSRFSGDGSYGTLTVKAYAKWQRKCGFTGKDANGIPGRKSLERLGRRHRFSVTG
ncbi:hypothetical protein [Flindersiella endophytica]